MLHFFNKKLIAVVISPPSLKTPSSANPRTGFCIVGARHNSAAHPFGGLELQNLHSDHVNGSLQRHDQICGVIDVKRLAKSVISLWPQVRVRFSKEPTMGAWGVLAFDNDDANDWANDLNHVDDLSLVQAAFDSVAESEDYLEAPDAANALAACEVLARLLGNPGYQNSYTEEVDNWVASHPQSPPAALLVCANAVIDRILGSDSELKELWSESDENSNWLASVNDLRRRLEPTTTT
jgi:hypothetical protein